MSDIIAGRNAVREAPSGTRPIQKSWSLKAAMGKLRRNPFPLCQAPCGGGTRQ